MSPEPSAASGASASDSASPGAAEVPFPTAFFGHPRGLATLFFTEFWERFSYYGMRSLLILFMTASAVTGGLGMTTARAGAVYGFYTGAAYLMCLPGGWLADRLLGQRRAVLLGGLVIAAGNLSLAIKGLPTFFLGLVLVACGTGLLKPNVSTMVGDLYPDDRARRDAGFSIFYMGINLGAFLAPLVCGWLGQRIDWHWAFVAAGVGMLVGVGQYTLGAKYLGKAGLVPSAAHRAAPTAAAAGSFDAGGSRRSWRALAGLGVLIALLVLAVVRGMLSPATAAIFGLALVYFVYQITAGGLDREELRRMLVIFVLFVFSALFWSGYEQAGSSLNLFAEHLTNLNIAGFQLPASMLQAVNPIFTIAFAPVFAWIWIWLGRRNPSSPTKFALGLLFMALGFAIMVEASLASVGRSVVGPGLKPVLVSPWWLVLTYFCHTCGELCLSPVGLSTVTKLAPQRKVSQMMGIWFLALSLGNIIGGEIAGHFEDFALYRIFGTVALVTGIAGIILFLLVRPLRSLIGGAE